MICIDSSTLQKQCQEIYNDYRMLTRKNSMIITIYWFNSLSSSIEIQLENGSRMLNLAPLGVEMGVFLLLYNKNIFLN
jgi:hypothetical protein